MNSSRRFIAMAIGLALMMPLAVLSGCSPTATSEEDVLAVVGKAAESFGCEGCVPDADDPGEGEPVDGEGEFAEGEVAEGEFAEGEGEAVEGETEPGEEMTITLPGYVPLTMVRIPAGAYMRGAHDGEEDAWDREYPRHEVTLTQGFYMGKYPVTQQQWLAVMGGWPGTPPSSTYGLGNNYPAYEVSWNDVQDFITALNAHVANTGQGAAAFRLPTEAEWEYACRAGTTTRFYFGDSLDCGLGNEDCAAGVLPGNRSDYMWFGAIANRSDGSQPVGGKLPNAFGLYDMHGNIMQWCHDWSGSYPTGPVTDPAGPAGGSYRIIRGCCWYNPARACRSARRYSNFPHYRDATVGFRLAR